MPNAHRKFVLFGQIYSALLENGFYDNAEKPDIDGLLSKTIADDTPDLADIIKNWANERKNINRGIEYSKGKIYKTNRLCYEITPNDEFYTAIIFRFMNKFTFNDSDYNVSWLKYDLENNSLSLCIGKNKTANVAVSEENAKDLFVYAEMQSLLKNPQFNACFEPKLGADFTEKTTYKL